MSNLAISARSTVSHSFGDWLARYWFPAFLSVYGLWVWLPFAAPVFMHVGWTGAGRTIYLVYSFFCHQLPERSFFFFGQKTMYSLAEIQSVWQGTINPMILRKFIGNESMGWKVAWSDRMVSFYGSIWLFSLVWYSLRRRVKPLSWWGFGLLLLPVAWDGSTHAISDLAGIGEGFRDHNLWLAALTNNSLSSAFYAGDALGSFNSWARLVTGLLSGLAIVWFAFPYIFQSQSLNQELDKVSYEKVLEQIKNGNSHRPGG